MTNCYLQHCSTTYKLPLKNIFALSHLWDIQKGKQTHILGYFGKKITNFQKHRIYMICMPRHTLQAFKSEINVWNRKLINSLSCLFTCHLIVFRFPAKFDSLSSHGGLFWIFMGQHSNSTMHKPINRWTRQCYHSYSG